MVELLMNPRGRAMHASTKQPVRGLRHNSLIGLEIIGLNPYTIKENIVNKD